MDGNSVSVLLYKRFIPQGKVRRRVQDLRIPSASYIHFIGSDHRLDLSHNESARMAVDSLLSQGLEEYQQVLREEGEVDFLSQPEKIYIMGNGRDGDTADASTSDASTSDDQLDGSSVDSQFGTQCPTLSTGSDPAVGVDLSCLRGATDGVLVKPSFEVHFQSHCGAASMKDLIREFMRKATESLVIVMDCFSDVELLCDLLEASRKRDVSVHLLLDHLNLSLFVSMWQGLKLSSRNFPKLSVRSVQGQTYCAKSGRKLSGQLSETFIITDWTEVLTGSYSFSWLSWQVHRSLAVLVKGSAVLPFHTEFLRLNSSSRAVPGFVNYIAVPAALPFSNKTSHAPQKGHKFPSDATFPSKLSRMEDKKAEANAKVQFLTSLESNRNKEMAQPAGSGAQVRPKPPQNVSASAPEPPGGAARSHHGSQRNGETLSDSRKPWSPAQVSHVQSQLSSLTVSAAAQKTFPTQRQCTPVQYQPPNLNQNYSNVGAHGLFFHQNEKARSVKTLGTAGSQKSKHQWLHTQSFRAKTDFLSPPRKIPPPSTPQLKDLKKDLLVPLIQPRGHQGRKDHQTRLQPHPVTQASSPSVPAAHLKPQLQTGPQFLSPAAQPSQESPLRLNWKSQRHAAKPKLAPRHSFLSSLYRPAWRPFHSNASALLRRSKSWTETQPSRFPKPVLLPDVPKT